MKTSIEAKSVRASSSSQGQTKRTTSGTTRTMNASGGSFKNNQQSSKDVRMGAEQDLDSLTSISKKKKNIPK